MPLETYALDSILRVMREEDAEIIDQNLLKYWIAKMVIEGNKISTCKRYFGKIHTIYKEWTGDPDNDIFAAVLPVFANLHEADTKDTDANLDIVKRLLVKSEQSADWQTACIFFYLLYDPAATLTDIINLTFAEAPRYCPQTDDIISAFDSSHGRKYVFDLKQGKSRPHEITRKLTKDLQILLSSAGMRFGSVFSRASVTSLWIAAALKSRINLHDIRACIATVPPEYSVLSVIDRIEITQSTRERIICTVADSINNYASRWFVMKLRQGTSLRDIKDSISVKLPGRLSSMTLFYPTRTEMHLKGRKRIAEEIPYIPDILFFKTQSNKVKSLFANIGDMAWCFRTSNSPDSDYAVIPHKQMTIFQQCIGRFTPDIKMELVDTLQPLGKGRRVKITGGIMAGYEGEILDVEDEPDKKVFFLSIAANRKARWTARVEDVFIQPIA